MHLIIADIVLHFRQLTALEKGLANALQDLEDVFNSALSDDDYQKLNGHDQDDIVIERLDSYFSSLDLTKVSQNDIKSSKNTTKYRQALIKQFLGMAKVKMCPRCLVPVRYFRSEYNSRLYLKPLAINAAKKYIGSMNATQLAKNAAGQMKSNEEQNAEGKTLLSQ